MELTFLTLSHNQVQYLERCIMSIINQQLPFEYEIILSDDASSDGTWELAQELAAKYPQLKLTQCDTNNVKASTKSLRSGWNRQNAYKLATGKYIVFIDADDYYKDGTEVIKIQHEYLELHPDCVAAMANNWVIKDGESIEKATLQNEKVYWDRQIITPQQFMEEVSLLSCTAFMFRRVEDEMIKIKDLKGFYSDTAITAYYLQFGNIICLDNEDSGYMYVQYQKSASHNDEWHAQDWAIWASRCIYIPALIPYWRPTYLRSRKFRGSMLATVKRIRRAKSFNQEVVHMFDDLHLWIYDICKSDNIWGGITLTESGFSRSNG